MANVRNTETQVTSSTQQAIKQLEKKGLAEKILKQQMIQSLSIYRGIECKNTPTLPRDMWLYEMIKKHLTSPADRANLARTCTSAYALGFESEGNSLFHNKHIRASREQVQTLLSHVIKGELQAAETMIKADPSLLLETGRVKDYAGRTIKGTALGMALGAEDVNLGRDCELISVSSLPANLNHLPIKKNAAYVRCDNQLFYVDKSNNECKEITLSVDAVRQFDEQMNPTPSSKFLYAEQLEWITSLTGHIHEEQMAEMIKRYLKQLPNGDEKIAAQIREQFPEDWEEQEKARAKRDSVALNNVVAAIAASITDEDYEAELQAFAAYLEAQTKVVITTGKHFNNKLLNEAFELYEKNYKSFGGNNSRKNNLLWQNIIGGIERLETACGAMALCQGPYYLIKEGQKFDRRLTFRFGNNAVYFPLDSDPRFRLGSGYPGWSAGALGLPRQVAVDAVYCCFVQNLSEKKQQRCDNLCHNQTTAAARRVVAS